MRHELEAWVDAHESEILSETQAILHIPSVEDSSTAGANAPFGQAVADALTHTLALCETLGMKTENFGGYAGHAEFGQGDEIVGMLGHLDVVPVGKDWTTDPWGGEIKDGWIYARGSADDKGPTYAALFGAKAVLDVCAKNNITLSRRIRLIFGCDEESGWQCMEHYFGPANQPKPTVAFTPDASFPLVYAEKGSFTAVIEKAVPDASDSPLRVVAFQSGYRPNMVPDEATATLAGDASALAQAAHVLAQLPGLTVTNNADGTLHLLAKGVSAHGARPQSGDNAAVKLLRALTLSSSALDEMAGDHAAWMIDLAKRANTDGSTVGIGGSDEITGALTSNFAVVELADGKVQATFNVRYPATWDGDETTGKFKDSVGETGWSVASLSHTPPLYVPQDAEPVKTLLRVYREQTGDMTEPRTMGGRTYATSVAPIGVAFGAAMEGDPEVAHQADEHFAVARLIQCAKIYAHALYELAK